jgi:hypothetical protein
MRAMSFVRWLWRVIHRPARARTSHSLADDLAQDDDVLDAWLDDDGMDASGS